jgi:hypothetical protein
VSSNPVRRHMARCLDAVRPPHPSRVDAEILAVVALLSAVLVIGLATVGDYGITVDEFNADDYGPKALAWYTSGFTDRSSFETVEDTLWYYGPWFHILTAIVQSFGIADPWTVRHAMTFITGLAGIAALVPIGRLAVGRWAGLVAVSLCLTTGYLYGSIFFTPIDVPFLFAMTMAMLAIIVMAGRAVPSWPATIGAGLLTGLAIATRSSGVITQVYLLAVVGLGALEALVGPSGSTRSDLLRIGARAVCALAVGWIAAVVLWPWLQFGNPFLHFKEAFELFANHPNSFEMTALGHEGHDDCVALVVRAGTVPGPPAGRVLIVAGGGNLVRTCSGIRILTRDDRGIRAARSGQLAGRRLALGAITAPALGLGRGDPADRIHHCPAFDAL